MAGHEKSAVRIRISEMLLSRIPAAPDLLRESDTMAQNAVRPAASRQGIPQRDRKKEKAAEDILFLYGFKRSQALCGAERLI